MELLSERIGKHKHTFASLSTLLARIVCSRAHIVISEQEEGRKRKARQTDFITLVAAVAALKGIVVFGLRIQLPIPLCPHRWSPRLLDAAASQIDCVQ